MVAKRRQKLAIAKCEVFQLGLNPEAKARFSEKSDCCFFRTCGYVSWIKAFDFISKQDSFRFLHKFA